MFQPELSDSGWVQYLTRISLSISAYLYHQSNDVHNYSNAVILLVHTSAKTLTQHEWVYATYLLLLAQWFLHPVGKMSASGSAITTAIPSCNIQRDSNSPGRRFNFLSASRNEVQSDPPKALESLCHRLLKGKVVRKKTELCFITDLIATAKITLVLCKHHVCIFLLFKHKAQKYTIYGERHLTFQGIGSRHLPGISPNLLQPF